ncbi:MAG: pilin [Candidatus Saccharibacteria bacterium]
MKRLIIMTLALLPILAVMNLSSAVASAAPSCPPPAAGSPKDQVLQGTGQVGTNDCGAGVTSLANSIVNILSQIVGVLAVIMVIWAGFKYITSGGDSNKITSAKNTLIYAIIGLVIVALAQIIVHFVISTSSSAASCPAGQVLNSAGTCVAAPK